MSEPWIKYEVAPLGPLWAWGVFVADANDHREAGKRQPWRIADHGVERLRNLAEGIAESRVGEIRATVGVNTKLSTPEFERQTVPEFCTAALARIGVAEGR